MARMTGGKALVESLNVHGVDTVFGVLGSTLLPAYDALCDRSDIRLIAPRGEDGAVHMADAYARVTGKVGVAMVTVGAGAVASLSAMGEAYAESWPVLNIVTQVPTPYLGKAKGVYHECPGQLEMFKPVTGWAYRVESVADIPRAVREAFRRMRSGRPRPVALEIPADLLRNEAEIEILPPAQPDTIPVDDAAVAKAAELLASAKSPLLWAGGGVVKAGAGKELLALAELLQAPILATNGSRGIVSEDHPLMLGNVLTMAYTVETKILETADCMLALGTRFSERATRTRRKDAEADVTGRSAKGWTIRMPKTLIHADIDTTEFGMNVEPQLTIHGDAKDVILKLLAVLRAKPLPPRAPRGQEIVAVKKEARDELRERVPAEMEMMDAIRQALPKDTIVTAQSIVGHWARYVLEMYQPLSFIFANTFGSMGFAFHAAIGAKIACPERPVVAFCGDGGFMFGAGELATIAHYRLNIPIVVFNNGGYKILNNTQRKRYGRTIGTELTNPDFSKLGEAFGFRSCRANGAVELKKALEEALAADTATMIEVPIEFVPYR
jgi:acetolactate synthase I/II/III large subunit